MSTLHSLAGNLIAAATIYGWRIDAIMISGLLWVLMASYQQILAPSLVAVAARVPR